MTLTDNAVEHLRHLLQGREAAAEEGLRLWVEKGGCAGLQYAMRIDRPQEHDWVSEREGVRLFVDRDSLQYLQGVEVDYVDDLNDSGFKVRNPNAARSCGCGTSFEPQSAPQES